VPIPKSVTVCDFAFVRRLPSMPLSLGRECRLTSTDAKSLEPRSHTPFRLIYRWLTRRCRLPTRCRRVPPRSLPNPLARSHSLLLHGFVDSLSVLWSCRLCRDRLQLDASRIRRILESARARVHRWFHLRSTWCCKRFEAFFNWSVCKILSSNWSIKHFKAFVVRLWSQP